MPQTYLFPRSHHLSWLFLAPLSPRTLRISVLPSDLHSARTLRIGTALRQYLLCPQACIPCSPHAHPQPHHPINWVHPPLTVTPICSVGSPPCQRVYQSISSNPVQCAPTIIFLSVPCLCVKGRDGGTYFRWCTQSRCGAVVKSTDLNLVVLVSAPTILARECWQLPDVSFVAHLLLRKTEMVIFVRTKGINRCKMLRTALGTW